MAEVVRRGPRWELTDHMYRVARHNDWRIESTGDGTYLIYCETCNRPTVDKLHCIQDTRNTAGPDDTWSTFEHVGPVHVFCGECVREPIEYPREWRSM